MSKATSTPTTPLSKLCVIVFVFLGLGIILSFGSGIYAGKFHKSVLSLIKGADAKGKKAFVFSTCCRGGKNYNKKPAALLSENGFEVIDDFGCKGFSDWGLFKLIGGMAKGHPSKEELQAARDFAKGFIKT